MKKRRKTIHDLIKERFESNRLPDERFTGKGYWDSVKRDEDGNPRESPRANPDILPESAGVWSSFLTNEQEGRLETIQESLKLLTPQEQSVIILLGQGLTLDQVGRKLGLKKTDVQSALNRARKKIFRNHSIREASGEH